LDVFQSIDDNPTNLQPIPRGSGPPTGRDEPDQAIPEIRATALV
jgi:hypothetical protein